MKQSLIYTIPFLLFTFLISGSLFGQEKEIKTPVEPVTYLQVRKSKDLSSFTLEVIDEEEFKYRKFLKESKKSDETYNIGSEKYTKKELTKLLRKGGRKSETVRQFVIFLNKENYSISKGLTELELELLYDKFREGTLDEYLDELPSVFSY